MLIFLLLWLARKRLLWLLGPAPAIVACSQMVIVACPCDIHVIGTCSCYCGLLPNGYCDLPVLLGPVHVIVACSQTVIVTCPCYWDLFMLLWLAPKWLLWLARLFTLLLWLVHVIVACSWTGYCIPNSYFVKWLKICYFTHFSSVVACSPWECCALYVLFMCSLCALYVLFIKLIYCVLWVMLIVKWNEWNVGNE